MCKYLRDEGLLFLCTFRELFIYSSPSLVPSISVVKVRAKEGSALNNS